MRAARLTLALGLGVVLTLAGCSVGDDAGRGPTPRAEQVPTPQAVQPTPEPTPELAAFAAAAKGAAPPANADAAPVAAGYDVAYELLYTAMAPSDALIDQWNAASDAQDWARVRVTSGRLAEALQALQTTVLAADWPTDVQGPAQDFALALDGEIGWYSYVSVARDDGETVEAVQQPWTDAAVTASDELWTVLEDGLAADG